MPAQRRKALRWVLPLILVVAVVCVVVVIVQRRARAYSPPPVAFDGKSEELKATVIVPTLDTPMPEGKNVIWCASFQIAWNEFRDDVIGEPVKITGAQEIADRLNNSPITKDVVDSADYYAKAGTVANGIIETIQHEMAKRFPAVPTPEIVTSPQDVVAYAYLAANVKFTIPFFDNDEEFAFNDAPVSSFGIREKDEHRYYRLRSQVEVLYMVPYEDIPESEFGYSFKEHKNEFAIDPCRRSAPYRIILACVAPKGTLGETVADLETKIAGWSAVDGRNEFRGADVLLVPNLLWRIAHHFRSLEGTDRIILNESCPITGFWCAEALQVVDFRLDRSGAELKSEARDVWRSRRFYFLFNRPFLIVMKKRGAERPFFVMWVDNAELLCKP